MECKHEWVASADPNTGRRNGPWTCVKCEAIVTGVEKAEELDAGE